MKCPNCGNPEQVRGRVCKACGKAYASQDLEELSRLEFLLAETETAKLTALDGEAGDYFGISVAIDRSSLVAGAYYDAVGTNQGQGSAYVFSTEPRTLLYLPLIRK